VRIAFVTSGLEPGRDGVGDYARLLSGELERQGHSTAIVSLHDSFVTGGKVERLGDGASLRLGQDLDWDVRFQRAGAFLEQFSPDWVSVQFVAYGFDPKGIVFAQVSRFHRLLDKRATHFNFHELWIGNQRDAALKARVLGWLQRRSIVRLLRQCRPRLVTTTNGLYHALLQASGVKCFTLPIFGNIPIECRDRGWLDAQLRSSGIADRTCHWLFVFFGTLHPEWLPEPLFFRILTASRTAGKSPVILLLGRPSGGKQRWLEWEKTYGTQVRFLDLGEQPPERVADVFQSADAGISTMPIELIGKSGSAAGMFDHGLPVIVSRSDRFRGEATEATVEPLIIRLDGDFEAKLASGFPRRNPAWKLSAIADSFLAQLEAARGS